MDDEQRSDLELIAIQAAALFRVDDRGRSLTTNEPDGDPAPRLFLGRSRAGNVWRLRADLADGVVAELAALLADEPPLATLDAEQPPRHAADYRRIIAAAGPSPGEAWSGPAWWIPAVPHLRGRAISLDGDDLDVLLPEFAYVRDIFAALRPCAVVVVDGAAVSACRSVRRTDAAAEAGVDTLPGFEGRGYATEVAAAWAEAVRVEGRLPLYSTAWDNLASRRVAAKLGGVTYGTDWSLA